MTAGADHAARNLIDGGVTFATLSALVKFQVVGAALAKVTVRRRIVA
jgi:hypothetical protein